MINTILPCEINSLDAVLLLNLFFDHSERCITNQIDDDLSDLSRHWLIRENPDTSLNNLKCGNSEKVKRELLFMFESQSIKNVLIVDLSSVDSFQYILNMSNQFKDKCHFLSSASIIINTKALSKADVVTRLTSQLLVGESSNLSSTGQTYIRSGCVHCVLSYMPNLTQLLSIEDNFKLECCCEVQAAVRLKQPQCDSPLVVISAASTSVQHCNHILNVLSQHQADFSKILLNQVVISYDNLDAYEGMLSAFPSFCMCIDSFTYQATFPSGYLEPDTTSDTDCGGQWKSYPSDGELLDCVKYLCLKGYSSRLCLSLNIRTKLQLRLYGGPGYSFFTHQLLHQLTSRKTFYSPSLMLPKLGPDPPSGAFTADEVDALVRGTMLRLLAWYRPPPLAELPKETLACHICAAVFEPGNHYSKFGLEYCSSACLAVHRKRGFK